MHERATFQTANGQTITGTVDDEHPDCRDGDHDVVFVVEGRARHVGDLPPGQLVVTVEHRTLRAMALVQGALRAGFEARLEYVKPPDSRRDRKRYR